LSAKVARYHAQPPDLFTERKPSSALHSYSMLQVVKQNNVFLCEDLGCGWPEIATALIISVSMVQCNCHNLPDELTRG